MNYIKRNFINEYLSEAIENAREDISYCEYTKDIDDEEYVLIVYRCGYVARICVTSCSNA